MEKQLSTAREVIAMSLYEFNGKRPKIASGTWVHETAQIIGDVEIGGECYIAAGAVLRGDFGRIRVGSRSSVQESCALHTMPQQECRVGDDCTVGHGAILHGCTVGNRSVVGMNATVADRAVIGEDCIIAENSMVRAGTNIPDKSLAAGSPAEVKKQLSEQQIAMKNAGAKSYAELTRLYIETAKKID